MAYSLNSPAQPGTYDRSELAGLRVLISGASVAGPTLAYWLRRYGCEVTVVERAPGGLRAGGQAVDVRGPALDVAERMGALELLRANRTNLRGMSLVDGEGTELYSSTEQTASGGRLDRPDVEILRDELARILVEAGGPDVEYLNGDSIADLTDGSGDESGTSTVTVRFESGARREFDLVVGADGVHSHTRRLVFGPEEDYLHHLDNYIAVWTAPNHLGLDRWEVAYRIDDADHVWGGMVMSVRDNTELRVYAGFQSKEPPSRVLAGSPEDHKRLVAEQYAGARWEMPRLLERMWEAPDFHFDALAQIHMGSWSRGRVALLGDAAHCGSPASGQGTSMAMIGGYVLAGELCAAYAAGGDHRGAFAAYERELREFVAANQKLALDLGEGTREAEQQGEELDVRDMMSGDFYEVVDSYTLRDY